MRLNINYNNFVDIVINTKKLLYQHILENETPKAYTLFAFDGPISYFCALNDLSEIQNYESLYINNANKRIENLIINKKQPLKYCIDPENITLSCGPNSWGVFYLKEFPNEIEFDELVINPGNDHDFRIEVYTKGEYYIVFSSSFNIITTEFLISKDISKNIFSTSQGNSYQYRFNLEGNVGSKIRISQKRRDNKNGNLTLNGYLIAYKEL